MKRTVLFILAIFCWLSHPAWAVKNEKPFVVLDDPLVNFDEDKIQLVSKLLKDISKDMQIVYFTCHESRKI